MKWFQMIGFLIVYLLTNFSTIVSAQNIEMVTLEEGQYRWGDSPQLANGSFTWVFDSDDEQEWQSTEHFKFEARPNDVLWLRIKLPAEECATPVIYIPRTNDKVQLYIDGKLIYQYGDFSLLPDQYYNLFFPYHLIVLPNDIAGKTAVFRFLATEYPIGIHGLMRFGSLNAILKDQASWDTAKVFASSICIFMAIISLFLFLRHHRKKEYLAFTGACLCSGTLVLFGTSFVIQFFFKPLLLLYITVISGTAWGIFWSIFLETIVEASYQKIVRCLCYGNIVYACCGLGVLIVDRALATTTLKIMPIILLTNFFVMMYCFRGQFKKNKEARVYSIGAFLWLVTCLHDILFSIGFLSFKVSLLFVGQIADIIALSTILVMRFNAVQRQVGRCSQEVVEKNEQLTIAYGALQKLAISLETLVDKRTSELEKQKKGFEQLFANSPNGIVIVDHKGFAIASNKSFERMYGYTSDELKGPNIYNLLVPKEQMEQAAAMFHKVIRENQTLEYEALRLSKDGTVLQVEVIVYPYEIRNDEVGAYIIYQDIFDRKQAESFLKKSEEKYRFISENTRDIIWGMDRNSGFTYMSPSVQLITGYSVKEALKQSLEKILTPSSLAIAQGLKKQFSEQNTSGTIENKDSFLLELELYCKNGSILWTESTISFVYDKEGYHTGYFGITRDISERHQHEHFQYASYQRRRQQQFLYDLAEGKIVANQEAWNKARYLQLNLPQHFVVYYVQFETWCGSPFGQLTDKAVELQITIDNIIDTINFNGMLAWEWDDGIGILVPVTTKQDKDIEIQVATTWKEQLEAQFSAIQFSLGITGGQGTLEDVARLCRQGRKAVTIGRKVWPDKVVYHYEDGGSHQFLYRLANGEEAQDYIDKTLGKLILFDYENDTNLVRTLDTIIKTPNLKVAAEEMFFHHKTIVARKQRIETILNQSIDSFEVRMELGIALQMLQFCRHDQQISANNVNTTTKTSSS